MIWTPIFAVGVTLVGSFFGGYVALRVALARFEERLFAVNDRIARHSNRLNRVEDMLIKATGKV